MNIYLGSTWLHFIQAFYHWCCLFSLRRHHGSGCTWVYQPVDIHPASIHLDIQTLSPTIDNQYQNPDACMHTNYSIQSRWPLRNDHPFCPAPYLLHVWLCITNPTHTSYLGSYLGSPISNFFAPNSGIEVQLRDKYRNSRFQLICGLYVAVHIFRMHLQAEESINIGSVYLTATSRQQRFIWVAWCVRDDHSKCRC